MIEKPIWYNNCEGCPDYVMTIPRLKECIEKLVDAVNAIQPKPEAKPLRDGDVVWTGKDYLIQFYEKTRWHGCHYIENPKDVLFNILDLAAAVQRGERIVTLTKDELEHLKVLSNNSCSCCERLKARLRAAMEGKQ